ncbi:MAG: hypothetical protein R2932_46065 [Caldilineaceae bacterium]
MSGTKLQTIQTYLTDHQLDGWLLYSLVINPIALAVAGLKSGGSRRWFLWLPAEGEPVWLVNAIEVQTPGRAAPEMQGKVHLYASWPALGKAERDCPRQPAALP